MLCQLRYPVAQEAVIPYSASKADAGPEPRSSLPYTPARHPDETQIPSHQGPFSALETARVRGLDSSETESPALTRPSKWPVALVSRRSSRAPAIDT